MKKNVLFFIASLSVALSSCGNKGASNSTETTNETPVEAVQTTSATVFDCDPGTDDACAFLLFAKTIGEPDYMISTFGNMPFKYTTRNMNIMAKFLGMNSILCQGIGEPSDHHEVTCGDFHGTDGLAGIADEMAAKYGVTDSMVASNKDLAYLASEINQKDSVTYIAVGPLSTLANLITKYPETLSHIKNVYIMGGGITHFNKEGQTEYNFAGDGPAVQTVLSSSLDITIFPLDITEVYAGIAKTEIDSMDFSKYPEMKNILLQNYASNVKYTKDATGCVIHDCLPVLYYYDKSKFTVKDYKLVANSIGHIEEAADGKLIHVAMEMEKDFLVNSIKESLK